MSTIPFSEEELKVVGYEQGFRGQKVKIYNYPVSRREAYRAAVFDKKPVWFLTGGEVSDFTPSVIPDNIARAFNFECLPLVLTGGKDMFGIDWEYVPVARGSMVIPGHPLLEDANDWKEKIVFPDIDSWDWEGSRKVNEDWFKNDKFHRITFLNGCWFERLVSFMDFGGAAVALIDEEQVDAVKALLHETTSLYMRIADKCMETYPVDGFCIHDDWGSQRAPLFSDEVARNIMLPEMKRFVDHIHEKGYPCELHSCGLLEERCDIFAEAGFDAWTPMTINDCAALFDRYGDKIMIGLTPNDLFDPEKATEEEQRAAARAFAKRFIVPGKVCAIGHRTACVTEAFWEELYRESRRLYQE